MTSIDRDLLAWSVSKLKALGVGYGSPDDVRNFMRLDAALQSAPLPASQTVILGEPEPVVPAPRLEFTI